MKSEAIGGYLQLELPRATGEHHREAMRFQSSRAAFLALLQACRPKAVWMPHYICDSMIEPLTITGVPVKRYELDEALRVKSAALGDGELLLYVNYFGICEHNVDDVLNRFPRERVVIDNAQAFFSEPRDCAATLYSPRKFVGVADGGYLVTQLPVSAPTEIDRHTPLRFAHLVKRIDEDAESGYADYTAAEESLKFQQPKCMSNLTRRILMSIDYADVRARRVANFARLHERLSASNAFPITSKGTSTPLCYPYLGGPADLRQRLLAQRIYTPCYWPEVAEAESMPELEKRLGQSAHFLPCDQRLSAAQLDHIAELVLKE
ncbi:hypothetical protein [Trinickia mobilis]|uniref:hypothetical protein n=1 Tax=Trinickia mobilis TaxID=2816356 RepID=UPI001A906038|nr:hypothetical protein [Trinickia mobilis]